MENFPDNLSIGNLSGFSFPMLMIGFKRRDALNSLEVMNRRGISNKSRNTHLFMLGITCLCAESCHFKLNSYSIMSILTNQDRNKKKKPLQLEAKHHGHGSHTNKVIKKQSLNYITGSSDNLGYYMTLNHFPLLLA